MKDDISMENDQKEHELIVELLPWLVNGRLSSEESERVEAHIEHCEKCRQEVSQLQLVNRHVAEEESLWQPSSAHFSSILSEVDRLESAALKQKKTKPSKHHGWSGFFQSLIQTPTPVRWTLALESVAIVVLLTVWNLSPQSGWQSSTELYQTLSDSPHNRPVSDMSRIRLLFNQAMTSAELTQLLQQSGAQIRQGPSALGIYIVEVPQLQVEASLELFRNHQHIRLAEPLQVSP